MLGINPGFSRRVPGPLFGLVCFTLTEHCGGSLSSFTLAAVLLFAIFQDLELAVYSAS